MDWETSSAGPSRSRSGTSGPSFLDRLTGAGAGSARGSPAPASGLGDPPTSEFGDGDGYSAYGGTEAGEPFGSGPAGEWAS